MEKGMCPTCGEIIELKEEPFAFSKFICPANGCEVQRWIYEEDEVPF